MGVDIRGGVLFRAAEAIERGEVYPGREGYRLTSVLTEAAGGDWIIGGSSSAIELMFQCELASPGEDGFQPKETSSLVHLGLHSDPDFLVLFLSLVGLSLGGGE